jgi:hypothetical protein
VIFLSYGDFWIVQVRPSRAPREFQELYQDWRRHERLVLPPPEVKVEFQHNPDWSKFKLSEDFKKDISRGVSAWMLASYVSIVFGSFSYVAMAPLMVLFWFMSVYETQIIDRITVWRFDLAARRSGYSI